MHVLWQITFKPITLFVNSVISFLRTETGNDIKADQNSWTTQYGVGIRKVGVNLLGAPASTSSLNFIKATSVLIASVVIILHSVCLSYYHVLVHRMATNSAD